MLSKEIYTQEYISELRGRTGDDPLMIERTLFAFGLKQLDGLSRDDFSEVYLFFDYDMHQTNLGKEDDADAVKQMLESFDNETENGKLYISYPMVEALRDYKSGISGDRAACFVAITDMKEYKNASAVRAVNPQCKKQVKSRSICIHLIAEQIPAETYHNL